MGGYCYDGFHRNATRVAIKWRGCRAAGGAGAVRSVAAGKADGMRVILARPRGFCAGVVRAIDIVEMALQKYGQPVYVRHEIVHTKRVVEERKHNGAGLVGDLDEVSDGDITVLRATGGS